jgi:hypothetical protein
MPARKHGLCSRTARAAEETHNRRLTRQAHSCTGGCEGAGS